MAKIVDLTGEDFADTEIVLYRSGGDSLAISINRPHCLARLTVHPTSDPTSSAVDIDLILFEPTAEATP